MGDSGLDTTLSYGLAAGELVHSRFAEVDALSDMVDSHEVDAVALVSVSMSVHVTDLNCASNLRDLIALSTLWRVPTSDVAGAANECEAWNSSLGLVAVLGDQAVVTVGAGNHSERSSSLIVAFIIADSSGRGDGCDERDDSSGLHLGEFDVLLVIESKLGILSCSVRVLYADDAVADVEKSNERDWASLYVLMGTYYRCRCIRNLPDDVLQKWRLLLLNTSIW